MPGRSLSGAEAARPLCLLRNPRSVPRSHRSGASSIAILPIAPSEKKRLEIRRGYARAQCYVRARPAPPSSSYVTDNMSFTGTQDKCFACEKTVHFIDLLTADGVIYHKTCFKCSHCKGILSMCSYSSMDGVLYCKTHFEQLFKETGSFSKKFTPGNKSGDKNELSRAPSKLSAAFSGTQDKCAACTKTVYPLEKMTLEGDAYHKSCFKCSHGGCILTTSSYAALNGVLYCKIHFQQLFMEKGSYSHMKKKSPSQEVLPDLVAAAAAEEQPAAEAAPPQDEE
ncbi:hypothetical protein ACQJBY_010792 [Aegilops geniculata]